MLAVSVGQGCEGVGARHPHRGCVIAELSGGVGERGCELAVLGVALLSIGNDQGDRGTGASCDSTSNCQALFPWKDVVVDV